MPKSQTLIEPVLYLEDHDLQGGKLSKEIVKIADKRPVLIMIQGSYCGHCQQAKPEYQKSANNNQNILHCTIVTDGDESEQKLAHNISEVVPFKGVPTFVIFDKKGQYKNTHNGPRTGDAFVQSCS